MPRVLRLTLLAPAIVEGILDGRETEPTLPVLLVPFPVVWEDQRCTPGFQTEFRITTSPGEPGGTRDE
jgi:hypothetical protein